MDRAQAHTLEAFVAALILISGIIFATQATAVTPLSASTSNQHIENQQQAVAEDLLRIAAEDGTLEASFLYWNASNERFGGVAHPDRSFYTSEPVEENPLYDIVTTAFQTGQIAYNIELHYFEFESLNETSSQPMVYMGTPSDNAVVATRTILLFNDSTLNQSVNNATSYTLGDVSNDDDLSYFAPDLHSDRPLYNVIEVRITVWRM